MHQIRLPLAELTTLRQTPYLRGLLLRERERKGRESGRDENGREGERREGRKQREGGIEGSVKSVKLVRPERNIVS